MISKLNVVDDQKNTTFYFLSTRFVCIFSLAICILLILLFPRKWLLKEVLAEKQPEPIALYYLQQLIQDNPENTALHVALVQQQIGLGEWQAAQRELAIMASYPALNMQTQWFTFKLLLLQAYRQPPGVQKEKMFVVARTAIMQLSHYPLNATQLRELAPEALSLKLPGLALQFYLRFVQSSPVYNPTLLKEIARTALFSRQYVVGAQYYFLASKHENTIAMQRNDVMAGLHALQADGLLKEGLTLIDKLPEEIVNDKAMLLFLAQYALAADRPDIAQYYIKRALLLNSQVKP